MKLRFSHLRWRYWALLVLGFVLVLVAARQALRPLWNDPVVVVEIGGTYESMMERSTTRFSPLIRGHIWAGSPKSDARLRFIDPQFGFETPLARFLSVGFDDNVVDDLRMSPQIEPLLIDDAMKVVVDLQNQWCAKGWKPMGTQGDPTIADTPEWRAYVRQGVLPGVSFWQAGDKYQAMLILARFRDSRHLDQERYLITLAVAEPWIPFDEIEDRRLESHHFPPPLPEKGAIPCPSQPS